MTKAEMYNKIKIHREMLEEQNQLIELHLSEYKSRIIEENNVVDMYKKTDEEEMVKRIIKKSEYTGQKINGKDILNKLIEKSKKIARYSAQFYLGHYFDHLKIEKELFLCKYMIDYLAGSSFVKFPIEREFISREKIIERLRLWGSDIDKNFGKDDYEWQTQFIFSEDDFIKEIDKIRNDFVLTPNSYVSNIKSTTQEKSEEDGISPIQKFIDKYIEEENINLRIQNKKEFAGLIAGLAEKEGVLKSTKEPYKASYLKKIIFYT